MKKEKNELFGIPLQTSSKDQVLEYVQKCIEKKTECIHIVSLNPEIIMIASQNEKFKEIIATAQIQIVDGVGIVIAGRLLHLTLSPRTTGVDLMESLCNVANNNSLTVLLIGGKPKLAERLAECQNQAYPRAKFIGIEGFSDISHQSKSEQEAIFSIVAATKPSLIFVAFGSPAQELWIEQNRAQFKGIICMGVGGSFDFLSNEVSRAPRFVRRLGFEWLFRLMKEPWRWRRQLRLVEFGWRVILQKIS